MTFILDIFYKCKHSFFKKELLDLTNITEIFNKGTNAISILGKSKIGEKTMLDTLFAALVIKIWVCIIIYNDKRINKYIINN